MNGLEKFSHLEDKIYRTIEQFKRERQEKDATDRELLGLRNEVSLLNRDKEQLEAQIERLMKERDEIKERVESMLDAIEMVELEAETEVVGE